LRLNQGKGFFDGNIRKENIKFKKLLMNSIGLIIILSLSLNILSSSHLSFVAYLLYLVFYEKYSFGVTLGSRKEITYPL